MQLLVDGKNAVLETGGVSISFVLKGDLGIEDGVTDVADVVAKNNVSYIVPGMIWKEVDTESVSGKVTISSSLTRAGVINSATLEFEGGRLTGWKGKDKQSQDRLDQNPRKHVRRQEEIHNDYHRLESHAFLWFRARSICCRWCWNYWIWIYWNLK